MNIQKHEVFQIHAEKDIVTARQNVRKWAIECGFGIIDQTKVVTAASELARNTWVHGRGGTMRLELVQEETRKGIRLIFEDQGPGILDIELALKDGYTTGEGLGLGLSGSKRLSNEFEIASQVGKGTCVSIIRWKW